MTLNDAIKSVEKLSPSSGDVIFVKYKRQHHKMVKSIYDRTVEVLRESGIENPVIFIPADINIDCIPGFIRTETE